MAGMTIWWDRPLVGYPRIDVSAICERGGGGIVDGPPPPKPTTTSTMTACEGGNEYAGGGGAFRKAWDEAHEAFREKAKTRERQVIDV
ncbi:hypothetical protein ACHAXA_004048 [Cyclostephanos tholiformis]|uniref:Uncharacterized protein n=1 Tax=Cyclostephanos tholiformis TaxID=382380 RepID=A0ABD3R6T7_9STRA